MKKRIVLLISLLALCIVGQVLLRPGLGDDRIGDDLSIAMEQEKSNKLTDVNGPLTDHEDLETENLHGQLIKQLLIMIGFVGLIGAGTWFFCKKLACNWTTSKSKNIDVAETVSLGPRKLLHIVRVGSKQYLLSSTAEKISMLTEITEQLNESSE